MKATKHTKSVRASNHPFVCSNKNCQQSFEKPLIIHNLSLKKRYYGCPFCTQELAEPFQGQEKLAETRDVLKSQKSVQKPASVGDHCPQYFGYLSEHGKQGGIPEACLTCPEILDCMHGNSKK